MNYDVVIIGAGIAGLRTGIHVLRNYPHIRCIILEKYNIIGGRIDTYYDTLPGIGKVQWEQGAYRISESHHAVHSLIRHYGLSLLPIESETIFINPNGTYHTEQFTEIYNTYIKPLTLLTPRELQIHTLYQLLRKIAPAYVLELLYEFPYFSEIHTLRADHGIRMLETEMSSKRNFYSCKEGLSAITTNMTDEFMKLGGSIKKHHSVLSISHHNKINNILCKFNDEMIAFTAPICVMALHSEAVKKIDGVSHLPVLKKVAMNPLLRIYAIFPVNNGKSWFSDMHMMITSDPIRFIIPVDSTKGVIMISYTDGDDADYWNNMKPNQMKINIMKHIRSLFPDKHIPNPIMVKPYYWKLGCSYWKPGEYNIVEESNASLYPDPKQLPGVFLCGESFAVNQCWMESALEQADKLSHHPSFKRACKALRD